MELNRTNSHDYAVELKRIGFPLTPWQVYEMGLQINDAAAAIFELLADKCSDQEWIDMIRANNRIVIKSLQDRIFLHRNGEMIEYYGSRGRFNHGVGDKLDREAYDNFADDVQIFLLRFDRFSEKIQQQKSLFSAKEAEKLCAELANEIEKFYQAITDLCPPGETNAALQELKQLNQKLCSRDWQ